MILDRYFELAATRTQEYGYRAALTIAQRFQKVDSDLIYDYDSGVPEYWVVISNSHDSCAIISVKIPLIIFNNLPDKCIRICDLNDLQMVRIENWDDYCIKKTFIIYALVG